MLYIFQTFLYFDEIWFFVVLEKNIYRNFIILFYTIFRFFYSYKKHYILENA